MHAIHMKPYARRAMCALMFPSLILGALVVPARATAVLVETRAEVHEDRVLLSVRFAGQPDVRISSRASSRMVVLHFDSARFLETARVFPVRSELVDGASLEQVSAGSLRLVVRPGRGAEVSVFASPAGQSPGTTYVVAVSWTDGAGSADGLAWPVRGRLSSRYGMRVHPIFHERRMHEGVDIAVPAGTSIRAIDAGQVTFAGDRGGAGLCVIVLHRDGVETRYSHCSKLLVKSGDRVRRHQVVARAGSTGLSTGPHVHFSVKAAGRAIDPVRHLRSKKRGGTTIP
jgi:murein DD-endopeptidase MepM/ murein hydrolase activator NlpD